MTTSRKTRFAVAALALCIGGGAMAQDFRGFDRGDGRDAPRFSQRGYERDARHERVDDRSVGRDSDRRFEDRRFDDRRDDARRFDGRQYDGRPHADWRRGGYVPREYRGGGYVVQDWRGQHLRQPPSGYQWVGVGGEFALAAIATGLIAQIIANQ